MAEAAAGSAAAREAHARAPVWLAAALLPLAGFCLLVAAPALDVRWEHHPSHFWLVVGAAGVNAVLAYATGEAARRRGDARLFLVSLAFLTSAGFLGLHALATPGVLLGAPNAGFVISTPVGLAAASVFAALSAAPLTGEWAAWLARAAGRLRAAVIAVMLAWAAVSLAGLPPLDDQTPIEAASGPLVALSVAGVVLYGVAAVRYLTLQRRRPSPVVAGVAAAFVLLGEAMIAVAFARSWQLTWWEWHLLMLAAFALVAYSARVEWHEERFSGLYLDDTLAGTREVSVVFADLAGFTSFSEAHEPHEVSAMLNTYFEVTIPPVVRQHGGEIDRLIGDAIMATFNTRGDQADHAPRAARAALAIRDAAEAVARENPRWPRFRIGVNTGPALVGVLGAAGGRSYTVVGDTVNLAARLESAAPVGGVTVGPATAERLGGAKLEPMGPVTVKGKAEPVDAFRLLAV